VDGQLAFAHPAHSGEVRPAALGGQELGQSLEFIGPAHEAIGACGALWQVVGGVALGEFGFGWGRQVGVVCVFTADELIAP
jgi:hypothetical protein